MTKRSNEKPEKEEEEGGWDEKFKELPNFFRHQKNEQNYKIWTKDRGTLLRNYPLGKAQSIHK